MGETMNCDQVTLIDELIQGKELAKQLFGLISTSPSSHETNEFLVEKILSSYEKALEMLKWEANMEKLNTTIDAKLDSHCSFANGSPSSEASDQDFKHKDVFKKRKTMPRWTEQVKVCSGTGLEGSLDDGYSWRKYGQKDILGSKFPRGYYRCTHKNVRGCLATKQVQRCDDDPSILEVTYRGRHTCTQSSYPNKAFPSKIKMELVENKVLNHQETQAQEEKMGQTPESFFSLGADLEVKTEDIDNMKHIFPSFGLASSSIGYEKDDNSIFNETMMENHFMTNYSPAFISPATSESNIFFQLGELGQSVQTSESDITEIISAPNSVTNSPIMDLDMLLDKGDFDSHFPFNSPEFLSV
ncbi:hypothetical protein L6164_003999 [Bauhinia variegata]|uniref:Uncharacterized protein n=1 Tax=Bauhinia variegata TaxID=167791 RepID=A0ACB9Q8L1_BAUVA|nr:hypothetical protein L6164_003999 [Bauhinia variegata]